MHQIEPACDWRMQARKLANDICKHFTHEIIQDRKMLLVKVDTLNQPADIFTKPRQIPQFLACSSQRLHFDGKKASSESTL